MGLRPRFTTPLSQARDRVVRYAIRPFTLFQPRSRFLIGFGLLTILTTLLLFNSYSVPLSENYTEGEVLTRAIISPADITTVDVAETEKRRAAARAATQTIFNFDSSRAETSVQNFRAGWRGLARTPAPGNSPTFSRNGGAATAHAIIHNFARTIWNVSRPSFGISYIYDDIDAERLRQEIVLVDPRNQPTDAHAAPLTRMYALTAAP